MLLSSLLAATGLTVTSGPGDDPEITSVEHDSRAVEPGALFCCIRGRFHDGHDHAAAAVEAGAAALLVERALPLPVPQIVSADVRAAMAPVAAEVYGHPSQQLAVVGVTGTNGKTTVVHLIDAVARAAGMSSMVIGTLTGERTTPESNQLQRRLRQAVDEGVELVAMEVSSHALVQHRVDAVSFQVAVFTNLSPEHLDFHRSIEEYFRAKAMLFEPERTSAGIVNLDDVHGRLLRDASQVPTVGFSLGDVEIVRLDARGTTFRWRGAELHLPMPGRFNVSNALAAAMVALELGLGMGEIADGLASASVVPGRMEMIDAGQAYPVVVDYAHTPDGLNRLLEAAAELRGERAGGGQGRVILVFGCGGDRDAAKRPLMGEVAAAHADRVIITDDNPRSEEPMAIIEAVLAGVPSASEVRVERDRRNAIRLAVTEAVEGDVVVIAGKGHETTQTTGETVVAFDDRSVAREVVEELLGGSGDGG